MSKRRRRTGRRKPPGERKPVEKRKKPRVLNPKKRVEKDLNKVSEEHRESLRRMIVDLPNNPYPVGSKRVQNKKSAEGLPFYRIRSGDWRAAYTVDAVQVVIYIVGHRSSIYDKLQEDERY